MSTKKAEKIQEDNFPEDVENVETNESIETQTTSLDELKKRQNELRTELQAKQAEFKDEMQAKRESLKGELAEKRAAKLKAKQAEKRNLKEERAKERAENTEKKQREGLVEKIANMEERHAIALAKLENLGDTVDADLIDLGLHKGDRVEFSDSKDKEHKMYGILERFWPYSRSYTTACAIKEEISGKTFTRSVFNVVKTEPDYPE